MRWWALSLFFSLAAAAFNVTVEDTDPRITYTPAANWRVVTALVNGVEAYHGGSIHISYHVGAVASMTFNSSSHIYYIGEGNSDHGNYFVTVDGVAYPVSTTFTAVEVPQMMLFDLALDPTKEHTISVTNAQDNTATVIDFFVYTFVELAPTTSATTSSSSSLSLTSLPTTATSASTSALQSPSTSTSPSSPPFATETQANASQVTTSASTTSSNVIPVAKIGLIAAAGAAVLVLAACIAWRLCRRQARAPANNELLFISDVPPLRYSTIPYSPAVSGIGSLPPTLLSSSDSGPFVSGKAAHVRTPYLDEKRPPPAYGS